MTFYFLKGRDTDCDLQFWVKPLITSDIIPSERREHFVQEVFWNIADIEKVNSQLAQALIARQKEQAIVTNIGDIMLEYMCEFHPFVAYGAHQIIGKFYFELEKKRNPQFAQFVEVHAYTVTWHMERECLPVIIALGN